MSQYSWVPVFQAIANELTKYEHNQKQLIQWLREIGIEKGLTDQTDDAEIELEEIDPFTFFSMFMKYEGNRRIGYFEKIIEKLELNISAPDDFSGVPSAQAMSVWLFPYKKEREPGHIKILWKLFNEVINNNLNTETFDGALKFKFVGFTRLTQCIFYCNPECFFPIDSQTRPFLENHEIKSPSKNLNSYKICLETIGSKFKKSFYELSYEAWYENNHVEPDDYNEPKQDICLIGTWKNVQSSYDFLNKSIQENGAWASWWSFIISGDAQKALKTPFYFYPNAGGGSFPVRLVIESYASSRGNDGILSPWQEITDLEYRNKKTSGNKKNEIFKTWLKVVAIEKLSKPLTLDDFEPAEPFSNSANILNQNAFGFVYPKSDVGSSAISEPVAGHSKKPINADMVPMTLDEIMQGVFLPKSKIENILELLKNKKNIVLQGPPGVGKTFLSKRIANALMGGVAKDRIGMVQFHQSYAYEDFIQGYRPDGTGFQLKDGVFHKFCTKASSDPENDYVFIIDEINRGNLSKVFGELMMLIESDKRGPDWKMPLTYSEIEFYVPKNLYILGLMNTADRSLAMVDYALRRRFAFIDLEPEFNTSSFREYLSEQGVHSNLIKQIVSRMSALNKKIADDKANLGPGFSIGHSFFCSIPEGVTPDNKWYERIIHNEIEPLLKEYWFDDPAQVETIVKNTLLLD